MEYLVLALLVLSIVANYVLFKLLTLAVEKVGKKKRKKLMKKN